jgi:hypothetical protein
MRASLLGTSTAQAVDRGSPDMGRFGLHRTEGRVLGQNIQRSSAMAVSMLPGNVRMHILRGFYDQ